APAAFRSTTATRQPSAARTSASALPRLRAPPVTMATRSRSPRSTSAPLEVGLAPGEERLDALRGVLRPQRLEEGAGLDLERPVDGRPQALVDRLDQEPGGDRRPPGELAGQGQALRGRDLGAQDEELQRPGAADQPGQPLGAAVAGDDAQVRLRLPHP